MVEVDFSGGELGFRDDFEAFRGPEGDRLYDEQGNLTPYGRGYAEEALRQRLRDLPGSLAALDEGGNVSQTWMRQSIFDF